MKHNPKWIEYQNKLEQQQQEKLAKKQGEPSEGALPPKMNRETKRRYIKHYSRQGMPKEEVERIIAMQQFGNMGESKGVNLGEVAQKVKNGQLPSNTLDILKEHGVIK